MTYGPLVWFLPDNGKQFAARFIQHVCQILAVENFFTITYHPHCNSQTERSERTILRALCHYVADHLKDCASHIDILTYSYSNQVHRATKCVPLELDLSRASQPFALAPQHVEGTSPSALHYLLWWKQWLQTLLDRAGHYLRKAQDEYRCDFDKSVRVPAQNTNPGPLVFVRWEC